MDNARLPIRKNMDGNLDDVMPIAPARAAQYLFYTIVGLIVITIVWASVAKLDRVTRGVGLVVTSNHLQEIQYLEGGIVEEILVAPGDTVTAGQLLVKLDPTQMNVEFAQGRDGYSRLAARTARLQAEAELRALVFPKTLIETAPTIVAGERALYEARQGEFNVALAVTQNKLDQRHQAFADAEVSYNTAKESLNLASQELTMVRRLVDKGIEPRMELLRARQRNSTARGEMQRAKIAMDRIQFEVTEAEGEIDRVKKTFAASAADDLAKTDAEFESLKGELPALQDKVTRTDVRAPIAGVVNRVLVSTIGGVVAPGETIIEVVPLEDTLLVKAQIKPADIGFLHEGQKARVSISAYDQSVYGAMDGRIEKISADAIEDEKTGERYFNITVRTNDDAIESKYGSLRILPGMAADVAILNGKRTVLAYIMKPLADVGNKALQDK